MLLLSFNCQDGLHIYSRQEVDILVSFLFFLILFCQRSTVAFFTLLRLAFCTFAATSLS